jgi:hypothetical protein
MKQSAAQVPALQTSPTAQLIPSGRLVQVLVVVEGWQDWQTEFGLTDPDWRMSPPMKHATAQLPPLHTPVGQLVPVARLVHAVTLEPGSQPWHALLGFNAPVA